MRKGILALVLVLALVLGGCAAFSNAVTGAQQLLCNPTDTQKQDAAAGVVTANAILAILTAIPNPTSGIAQLITSVGGAATIFATVESGGCVLTTQLAAALGALDNAAVNKSFIMAQAASTKGMKAFPVIPPMPALHAAIQ